MMTEAENEHLQETRRALYEAFGNLIEAGWLAVAADPDIDPSIPSYYWRREDGVSLVMEQKAVNELVFHLQVPADDIYAWKRSQ